MNHHHSRRLALGADLTGFAVNGALEGIFHYMGPQEADIRSSPAGRSTGLLRKLFG